MSAASCLLLILTSAKILIWKRCIVNITVWQFAKIEFIKNCKFEFRTATQWLIRFGCDCLQLLEVGPTVWGPWCSRPTLPANRKHLYNIYYNVGSTLKTLGRRCTNVIQMFCVCWAQQPSNDIHISKNTLCILDIRYYLR